MNIAFFLLWVFIFLLTAVFLFFAIDNIKGITDEQNNPYNFPPSVESLCYPSNNINLLPIVTSNFCCKIAGNLTTKKPYQNPSFLDGSPVLVDIAPISYQQACDALCYNFDPLQNVCNDSEPLNPVYYNCLNLLKPVGLCTQKSMPIARVDETAYYMVQGNQDGCLQVSCT